MPLTKQKTQERRNRAAKKKLKQEHSEGKGRLDACRRFLRSINPSATEEELAASPDCQTLLDSTQKKISKLEEGVQEVEK